jgi:archaellum component FlaD/FlaE
MSVREEVLSELETKLESLVDMFGKYMTSVVSEKSIKMEDEKEVDDKEKEDDEDDTCTEDDKEDDSTDDVSAEDDKENQKMIDEEKPKKSKK